MRSTGPGRRVIENKHSNRCRTSCPRDLLGAFRLNAHTDARPRRRRRRSRTFNVGRLLVLNDPPAWSSLDSASHTQWNLSPAPDRYCSPRHNILCFQLTTTTSRRGFKMRVDDMEGTGDICQALHVVAKAHAAFDEVAVERAHRAGSGTYFSPPPGTVSPRLVS